MSKPAIYKFAYSDSLRRFVDPFECGWQDGGCYIFAAALHLWLGPASQLACLLPALSKKNQTAHHFVCGYGHYFADADGVFTRDELLDAWRVYSRCEAVVLESPFEPCRVADILQDPFFSAEIARMMATRFGPSPSPRRLRSLLGPPIGPWVRMR